MADDKNLPVVDLETPTIVAVPPSVPIYVMDGENGDKMLVIGPVMLGIPLIGDTKQNLVAKLTGGIEIPSGVVLH